MGTYFWIAMPVETFFSHCNETMKRYNVTAYVEMSCGTLGKSNYVKYTAESAANFIDCFSSPNYHTFFFSSYLTENSLELAEFGLFYNSPISDYSIEGNGGRETDKTRELIHLRILNKKSDKSMSTFYAALQRSLKKIPDLRSTLIMGNKKLYYLPTSKIIIPQNSHSRNIQGTWEEHCLNLKMFYEQE
jgi:hypothetical protein